MQTHNYKATVSSERHTLRVIADVQERLTNKRHATKRQCNRGTVQLSVLAVSLCIYNNDVQAIAICRQVMQGQPDRRIQHFFIASARL